MLYYEANCRDQSARKEGSHEIRPLHDHLWSAWALAGNPRDECQACDAGLPRSLGRGWPHPHRLLRPPTPIAKTSQANQSPRPSAAALVDLAFATALVCLDQRGSCFKFLLLYSHTTSPPPSRRD